MRRTVLFGGEQHGGGVAPEAEHLVVHQWNAVNCDAVLSERSQR